MTMLAVRKGNDVLPSALGFNEKLQLLRRMAHCDMRREPNRFLRITIRLTGLLLSAAALAAAGITALLPTEDGDMSFAALLLLILAIAIFPASLKLVTHLRRPRMLPEVQRFLKRRKMEITRLIEEIALLEESASFLPFLEQKPDLYDALLISCIDRHRRLAMDATIILTMLREMISAAVYGTQGLTGNAFLMQPFFDPGPDYDAL